MRPVVRALQKIFDAGGGIPLLLLVGYFDVMIIGGAALIARFVETHGQVQDNAALTCPVFGGVSGSMPAHGDCGKPVAGRSALSSAVPAGIPLQRTTSLYIWVRHRFHDAGD
jgi:hypothetical protein